VKGWLRVSESWGGSEFVLSLRSEAEEREKETLRLSLKISDLPSLAERIVAGEGVDDYVM